MKTIRVSFDCSPLEAKQITDFIAGLGTKRIVEVGSGIQTAAVAETKVKRAYKRRAPKVSLKAWTNEELAIIKTYLRNGAKPKTALRDSRLTKRHTKAAIANKWYKIGRELNRPVANPVRMKIEDLKDESKKETLLSKLF